MYNVKPLLLNSRFPALRRAQLTTLQMNLGYLCNLSCVHCHVNAGPKRTELMTREVMANALQFAEKQSIQTLDLTGGSPEMNPDFRWLVETARRQGLHIIDRCNPTILVEPGYEWAAEFLAGQQVEIIASLPCYIGDNVDAQRGKGVFSASIAALKRLNELGYGRPDSGLALNLVFNPQGPVLPPPQEALERQYRDHLAQEFGIVFNRLLAITNMPIQRFGAVLMAGGKHETDSRQVFRCRFKWPIIVSAVPQAKDRVAAVPSNPSGKCYVVDIKRLGYTFHTSNFGSASGGAGVIYDG